MSVNKKYFWLKMEENFFNQKEIKKLRRIAGGDTYVIIYLKMSLISLKEGGKLYYEGIEDSFAEELAYELDESVDNVKMTISFLESHNMIESYSNEELFMNRVEEMTGKDTDEAKRKRRQRNNAKLALEHTKEDIVPQLSESVHDNNYSVQERTPEIELETELNLNSDTRVINREEEKNTKKENSNFDRPVYENYPSNVSSTPVVKDEPTNIVMIPKNISQELHAKFVEFMEYKKLIGTPIKTSRPFTDLIEKIGKEYANEIHLMQCISVTMAKEWKHVRPDYVEYKHVTNPDKYDERKRAIENPDDYAPIGSLTEELAKKIKHD